MQNALIETIHLDNTQRFRYLIYGQPSDLKVNDQYLTQVCALSDSPGCMAISIAHGSPVNIDGDEMAPLNCSSMSGSLETAALLIEAGAYLNHKYHGETPLMLAVRHSTIQQVELLLSAGAEPCDIEYASQFATSVKMLDFFIDTGDKDAALEAAVAAGKTENVEFLLEHGAKPVKISLLTACSYNYAKIVKMLLEHGVEADDVAMQTCIYWNSLSAMQELINSGLKVIPFDVHYAVLHNKPLALTRLLKEDVDIETEISGTFAVHTAVRHGRVECLKILLEHGASVNGSDVLGCTPLHWAALRRKPLIMSILLEHGAIVNIDNPKNFQPQIFKPESTWSPIHVAVEGPGFETVQLLLEHNAKQVKKWDSKSPLHTALSLNREDLVPMLVENGADLRSTDLLGRTPVEYALASGREDLANLIKQLAKQDAASAMEARRIFNAQSAAEVGDDIPDGNFSAEKKSTPPVEIKGEEEELHEKEQEVDEMEELEKMLGDGLEADDDGEDALEMLMKMQEAQDQQGSTNPLKDKENEKETEEEENLDDTNLDDELAAMAAEAGDLDDANLDDELAAMAAEADDDEEVDLEKL